MNGIRKRRKRPLGRKGTWTLSMLRPPSFSVTFDLLVVLSLLMNVYSFYQNATMSSNLNKIVTQLSLMNNSIEKNGADLEEHLEASDKIQDTAENCPPSAQPVVTGH
jgi:hypothetical protein